MDLLLNIVCLAAAFAVPVYLWTTTRRRPAAPAAPAAPATTSEQDEAEADSAPHVRMICLACGDSFRVGVHFHLDEGVLYPCLDSEDVGLHELTCKGEP